MKKVILIQSPAFLFEVVPMFYKEAKKLGFFDKFYVVTDYKKHVNMGEDFKLIKLDKDLQFSSNILYALDFVEEDIFTLCCEDHIFTDQNDVDKWNKHFDYFLSYPEMGFLRLSNTKKKVLPEIGCENDAIFPISTKYRYYISLQVAFWRKEYLRLALHPGLDAADFERKGAKKTRRGVRDKGTSMKSYSVKSCVARRTNFYKDGKYYRRQFVDYALDNNMEFNMEKKIKNKQGIMSCQEYIERFKNNEHTS
jgi:hypothetical protein